MTSLPPQTAHRRRLALRLLTLALLAVVAVWWWRSLARPAPPAPAPAPAAGRTISRLLAARGELGLSGDQVARLQALAARRSRVLATLGRQREREQRRLEELTRASRPGQPNPDLVRQGQLVAALEGSRRELERRYQREGVAVLTPRQQELARARRLL